MPCCNPGETNRISEKAFDINAGLQTHIIGLVRTRMQHALGGTEAQSILCEHLGDSS